MAGHGDLVGDGRKGKRGEGQGGQGRWLWGGGRGRPGAARQGGSALLLGPVVRTSCCFSVRKKRRRRERKEKEEKQGKKEKDEKNIKFFPNLEIFEEKNKRQFMELV
jgi:hypothetical protein